MILAASESEGGFHAPSIADFFPPAILFEDTIFQIDRIWILRIIATVVLLTVFLIGARRAKLVPGRLQNVLEMGIDFVRVQIVEEIMGKETARRFVPMIATIFFAVLAFNITAVIPGLNLAGTSRIGLPLVLALWVFVTYWAVGIKKHGLGGYLKNNLFPPGIPWPIYIIVTPIELLQILVIRPASLAIRLAANMIAGHIMLVLCFAATQYFIFEAAPAMKAFGALTLAGGFAITLFEVLVAFLQAYIFALLAAVYINMSLEEEH
ncbi:F0F1 ATP synthase subunit A [Cellulosimicrobium marinum]|uniref:F0F1 ATP synthase subunit A n=1 Tax=Cellulosimicrobium marinum TaxID=1638992 RepID=UPI001E4AC92C|nr:F0F1 ATP synthase subunit A [Cellulosimicrobium marinum]MCB7138061.1 F0F1 ATP synthase subunit A [Cellulosimicrobium marinum]